jgi:hypothetical protein
MDPVLDLVNQILNKKVEQSFLMTASTFNTKQWSCFLRLAKTLDWSQIKQLEDSFLLTEKNDEVKSSFYELVIRSKQYDQFAKNIDAYLTWGRIKYIAPIYQALMDMGQKKIADDLFAKHKGHNNAITNGSIVRRLATNN